MKGARRDPRRRAKSVGRAKYHAEIIFPQSIRKLPNARGLARSVHADNENHTRPLPVARCSCRTSQRTRGRRARRRRRRENFHDVRLDLALDLIAVGKRIVVCYTQKDAPTKAFFRVIHYGTMGSASEITVSKDREYNLRPEYMQLYAESDRIWFLNTLTTNTLYELKIAEKKGQ